MRACQLLINVDSRLAHRIQFTEWDFTHAFRLIAKCESTGVPMPSVWAHREKESANVRIPRTEAVDDYAGFSPAARTNTNDAFVPAKAQLCSHAKAFHLANSTPIPI